MKTTVVRACGHEEIVEVFGSAKQRETKLKWLANYDCEDCKEAAKAAGCKEVEMHYSEYKTSYADCETKKGSYDRKSKTIVVYVPIEEENETADTVTTETVETVENNESPKYNKSNIMKRAWELYRNAKGSFSSCLKYAWAEVKGSERAYYAMEKAIEILS